MAAYEVPLLKFEEIPGFFEFSGDIKWGSDETKPGWYSEIPDICRCDKPMKFTFKWTQDGWVTTAINGKWVLEMFFEKMGGGEYTGPDIKLEVPHVYGSGFPYSYEKTIDLLANTIPEGTYRIVARIKFLAEFPYGSGTYINTPIVAFDEVGLVEFYSMP